MFELKSPSINTTFTCPDCNCKFGQSKEVIFCGTNVLADCECECCENRYYHTVPTGHAALFPISFSQKTNKTRFDEKAKLWLAKPLINSIRNNNSVERLINKKVFRETREIILLNCLDSCYGHVFLRILNAQKYLKDFPGKGLVLLIPSSFEWLIPDGIAEIWMVEAKLSDFNKRISNLDSFVKEELKRFTSALLSEVPIHPDPNDIEMKSFLKTEKFDLDNFEKESVQITFILREDRFWLNNRFDAFLMKAAVSKGRISWMRKYFVIKQNTLIKKLATKIGKDLGRKVTFYAAGIGTTGDLGNAITDLRKDKIDSKVEKEWCELYAKSHMVIGIHGSNMLIPTALSAGFIELLPRYKIDHITEDISLNHAGRYNPFLGRYLDEFSSVKLVATHVVSMINVFPLVKKTVKSYYSENIK